MHTKKSLSLYNSCQKILGVAIVLVAPVFYSRGQGTVTVTFDGYPPQPPGTVYGIHQYAECLYFTAIGSNAGGFVRNGGGIPGFPNNGTAFLQADIESSLAGTRLDGLQFSLISVDLAEFSTVVSNAAIVRFVGYRHDGTVVTTDFTTDGIIDGTGPIPDFQTFTFDNRFANLDRFEIPSIDWSLDNLRISIPEPRTAALLLFSGILLLAVRKRLDGS